MMNNCNCKPKCRCEEPKCGCEKPKCGCGKPILAVEDVPNEKGLIKFNVNGVTSYYDAEALVKRTETDTSMSINVVKRLLTYMAERHTDTISAKELGMILHLTDLGDVDVDNVENNSLLVYKKDRDCGEGCQSTTNGWQGWNSDNNLVDSLNAVMGFDTDGSPTALNAPLHTDQYYFLGWNAQNKLQYMKPVEFASAEGKKQLYVDPATGQIGTVAE